LENELIGKVNVVKFAEDYLLHFNNIFDKGCLSILTGNHDIPRISLGSDARELNVAYAFLLTLMGMPFIYYGDKVGLRGSKCTVLITLSNREILESL